MGISTLYTNSNNQLFSAETGNNFLTEFCVIDFEFINNVYSFLN